MVITLFKKPIFLIIAMLSIATTATANANTRNGQHKPGRIAQATVVCDLRGCSDWFLARRAAAPAAIADAKPRHGRRQQARVRTGQAIITCDARGCSDRAFAARAEAPASGADAQPRRERRQRAHIGAGQGLQGVVVCDLRGCSDRRLASRAEAPREAPRVVDANGNAVIVGGRPAGCPYKFCGCEASLYLFGEIRPYLNLAANWIRKFPRTAPAPGMVAARSGHVMVLISHAGGNDWLVHDGNSGGGLTRRHVQSISRYVIVDPRGSRSAAR